MKIMAIGMGKEFGATVYHRYFLRDSYGETIEAIVDRVTATRPLLFGVGIAEDGLGNTAEVQIMPAATVPSAEAAMLGRVQAMMPKLPFDDIDVLVIDEMGKDISRSGFDHEGRRPAVHAVARSRPRNAQSQTHRRLRPHRCLGRKRRRSGDRRLHHRSALQQD
jgi:hypothetical protein